MGKCIVEGQCYICGKWGELERHHVFGAANRKKADKMGLVLNLCHRCHNEPPGGVHFNQELDKQLKAQFQEVTMEVRGWNMERWMAEFGKNYL